MSQDKSENSVKGQVPFQRQEATQTLGEEQPGRDSTQSSAEAQCQARQEPHSKEAPQGPVLGAQGPLWPREARLGAAPRASSVFPSPAQLPSPGLSVPRTELCPQGICSPLSLGLSPPPSPLKFWGERLLVLQPMFPPWGGLPGTTCNCSHPPHPSPSALRSVIESVAGTFGSVPGGTPHMDAGKSTQQASA